MRRLALVVVAVLALAGCGSQPPEPGPSPEPGEIRLSRGLQWSDAETTVGVGAVVLDERPPVALLFLTDRTEAEPRAQDVRLAVGESARVGSRRFVLVGAGEGERRPYVRFRLEPVEPEDDL